MINFVRISVINLYPFFWQISREREEMGDGIIWKKYAGKLGDTNVFVAFFSPIKLELHIHRRSV